MPTYFKLTRTAKTGIVASVQTLDHARAGALLKEIAQNVIDDLDDDLRQVVVTDADGSKIILTVQAS